jgi:hypothetical protein
VQKVIFGIMADILEMPLHHNRRNDEGVLFGNKMPAAAAAAANKSSNNDCSLAFELNICIAGAMSFFAAITQNECIVGVQCIWCMLSKMK